MTWGVQAARRLAICRTCALLQRSVFGDRCVLCHCFVVLKVRVPSQRCAAGYW